MGMPPSREAFAASTVAISAVINVSLGRRRLGYSRVQDSPDTPLMAHVAQGEAHAARSLTGSVPGQSGPWSCCRRGLTAGDLITDRWRRCRFATVTVDVVILAMNMTAKAALSSLSRNLRRITREADTRALRAYSAEFRRGLALLSDDQAEVILALHAEARQACDARLPLIRRGDGTRRKWDAARIEMFRKALAQTCSDEGAARIMGMTKRAVRLARLRYFGAPTTGGVAKAA
jgi:hypothetical protein